MSKKNTVILFNPFTRVLSGALLALSGPLKESGYDVVIFDNKDALKEYLENHYKEVLFVGITCLTGNPIKIALGVSETVKKIDSTIPIVVGGYHPSLMPEQTVMDNRIDMVVRGQGERTIVELANALKLGKALSDIKGLIYKNDGKIKVNEPREVEDINNFPPLNYDSVESEKYIEDGLLPYFSSRGCPHRCAFCTVQEIYGRKWYGYSPDRVVKETTHLMDKFNLKGVLFSDDNVFVDKERVEKICDLIIKSGLKFKWVINSCRVDYFVTFSDDFLQKLKDAGCYSIGFGGESGSQKILDSIDKGIKIEQIIETVEKCKRHDIKCVITFMIGLPHETKEDVLKTLDLIDKLHEINPEVVPAIYTYVPYPGTYLYNECINLGLKPRESFEEWGNYNWGITQEDLWESSKEVSYLDAIAHIAPFVFRTGKSFKFPFNFIYTILRNFALFRWKRRAFNYAYEWKLINWVKQRIKETKIMKYKR
jgi:radical SAM superfamily enzyme YgiQ (UPF0313 family)